MTQLLSYDQLTYALVIAVAYLLYKIASSIYRTRNTHVDDDDLRQYWNGHLEREAPSTYKRVRHHLGHCTDCHERLQQLIDSGEVNYNSTERRIRKRL